MTDTPQPVAPADGIVDFAAQLVRIPSRAGIDPPDSILDCAADWLHRHALGPMRLHNAEGRPVALLLRVDGRAPGPAILLNACLDTAPYGDASRWRAGPTSARIEGGKLWGRGAADSKMGVAILAHVACFLASPPGLSRGTVYVLFDADEHTGAFGGVRAFVEQANPMPQAAVLGYPGDQSLTNGSRGFLRVRVHVSGRATHSGAVGDRGVNAISKMAALVAAIDRNQPRGKPDNLFTFGPCATVTRIEGGEGFSQVPDSAVCNVDIRLTPGFEHDAAQAWLQTITDAIDRDIPSPPPSWIEPVDHWPAYGVDAGHPLVASFLRASRKAFGRDMPALVCGPSNIGNLLAAHGVSTICAPGVACGNVHGIDEYADLSTVGSVYSMFCAAALDFLQDRR